MTIYRLIFVSLKKYKIYWKSVFRLLYEIAIGQGEGGGLIIDEIEKNACVFWELLFFYAKTQSFFGDITLFFAHGTKKCQSIQKKQIRGVDGILRSV